MEKKFITAITCMDGRIQSVVNKYLQEKYNRLFVDTITAAGPVLILSEKKKTRVIQDLRFRTDISINTHDSNVIALVGHFDCAGVPLCDEQQALHIMRSVKEVKSWYEGVEVIGLWVPDSLEVIEV